MRAKRLDRRAVLRGMGGIAIGLPFLPEMVGRAGAVTAESAVPVRAFNVFFGLGIPAPLQQEGFEGVLEPLKPLADKLLIMRGVDHVRCDESGINAHFDGSSAAFTAEPPAGEARSGGPSLEQVIRHAHYPGGQPEGMVPTLVAGTFFRRSRISRYIHSYNPDGSVAGAMQESPRELFERVFGTVGVEGEGEDARRARLKRSVLDSVVDQYKHFTGNNSPLGQQSKGRVKDHLDRLREFEQRAYSLSAKVDGAPPLPVRSALLHGGAADPGGQGIDITLEELTTEWRMLAELYALAIKTDRVRFGSLTFLAAGERIRLTGQYQHGSLDYEFNDRKNLGKGGDAGCSHEYWHQFDEKKSNENLKAHAHMKLREVAYFLSLLDGEESREANGKTILENALLTISTESGDGRHSNTKRELSGIFHACTSANGRFKTGEILDVDAEGVDVYNTMLGAMGTGDALLGGGGRERRSVLGIRA